MKWKGRDVRPGWTRGVGAAGGFFLVLAGIAVAGICVVMLPTWPTVVGVGGIVLGALFVLFGVYIMAANA